MEAKNVPTPPPAPVGNAEWLASPDSAGLRDPNNPQVDQALGDVAQRLLAIEAAEAAGG